MPFFGKLALHLKPRLAEFGDFVSSMAVSFDATLVVNEAFVERLDDSELAACIVHEILHPALLYWDRVQHRLPGLFNEAHDHSINLIIQEVQDANLSMPDFMLVNHAYSKLSAEEIYEILFKKRKDAKERNRALVGDCRADLATGPAMNWKEQLIDAVRFHEKVKGRGTLPAGLSRVISQQLNEPQVDWVETVKRFLGEFGRRSVYTRSRPSVRSESAGEYLPSLQASLPQIAVLLDTSGSISKEELTLAVVEINGICEDLDVEVRVIVIDAKIHYDITLKDVSELKIRGNGGSDFDPAFQRLEEEGFTGVVIAITDGQIKVPETKPECIRETLWLVGSVNGPPTDAWGEVVKF